MRAPPRPGTWDNAGCGSYCRRSRYGRSPHSAPHARRAALDGAHHLELVKAHAAAVGIAPCGPVAAEDVRDLQTWPGHADALRRRSGYSLWNEPREPVQRAHDFANDVGRHLGVARRRVQLGVSEQDLNHANVNVLLHRRVCELSVPERRTRHLRPGLCGTGGGPNTSDCKKRFLA